MRFLQIVPWLLLLGGWASAERARAQIPLATQAPLAPGVTLHFRAEPFTFPDTEEGPTVAGCAEVFGVDSRPEEAVYRLAEAYVVFEGVRHALNTTCMFTCSACGFDAADITATPNPADAGYQLDGAFSDGAGSYDATWFVTPTGTVRTEIVSGYARLGRRERLRPVFDGLDTLAAYLLALEGGTATCEAGACYQEMRAVLETVWEELRASADLR